LSLIYNCGPLKFILIWWTYLNYDPTSYICFLTFINIYPSALLPIYSSVVLLNVIPQHWSFQLLHSISFIFSVCNSCPSNSKSFENLYLMSYSMISNFTYYQSIRTYNEFPAFFASNPFFKFLIIVLISILNVFAAWYACYTLGYNNPSYSTLHG